MPIKSSLVLALTLPLMLTLPSLAASKSETSGKTWLSDWESIGEEDGITGQCRQHKSKINQCKMSTTVNHSLSEITALLLDGDGVSGWAPNTLSSETLEDLSGENTVTVYMTYNFPGAVNRDTVTQSTATQDPSSKEVKVKFQSLNIEGPKKDLRLVRFPLMIGSWTLTPISSQKTLVEHLNLSLPGGLVQQNLYYLYNLGLSDASFDTLRALKKAVKDEKYKTAELSFISDF